MEKGGGDTTTYIPGAKKNRGGLKGKLSFPRRKQNADVFKTQIDIPGITRNDFFWKANCHSRYKNFFGGFLIFLKG